MTAPTTTELTTRDVLLQIDRRLILIEGDLRTLDAKVDHRIDDLRRDLVTRIDSLFAWSIVTLVGIAGVLLAAIKL